MNPKSININISLHRNGATKTTSLRGYAYPDSGFLQGEIPLGTDLSYSEAVLLTAFTLTGCPIAARVDDPSLNPWVASNGRYQGNRTLMSSSFNAASTIRAEPDGDEIEMDLSVRVDGTLPEFLQIHEPFQEEIAQTSIGELRGRFDVSFLDDQKEVISAAADTSYKLPIDFPVDTVWRNITIKGVQSQTNFSQIEQIDLFGNQSDADADLVQKGRVARVNSLGIRRI